MSGGAFLEGQPQPRPVEAPRENRRAFANLELNLPPFDAQRSAMLAGYEPKKRRRPRGYVPPYPWMG